MMMSRWVGRGQPKEEEEERKEGRGRVKREYLGWGGGAGLGLRPPPAFDPTSLLCVCGPGSILCKLISWSWVVMTVRVCLGCGPHVGRSSTFSTYDM